MPRSMKLWAGLYGLAFHLVALAVVVWVAIKNNANVSAQFWWTVAPPFIVASFVVYAVVVGPYVPRRPRTRGAVFFDSAVGMFAECAVTVLTVILYALIVSTPAFSQGGVGGYFADVATTSVFAFLWSFGSFFTQILVVGNAAGLVGWWVLKRVPVPPAA